MRVEKVQMQGNVTVSRYTSAHVSVCDVCAHLAIEQLSTTVLNFTQPRIPGIVSHASRVTEAS